jgi:hypothetical protein
VAQLITVNQNKGSRGSGILVVRADSSGSVNVASSSTVTAANTAGETVSALTIASAAWTLSSATDSWALTRGANTVYTLRGQSGSINFWQENLKLENSAEEQANVVFTLSGGSGSLVLKLHKKSGA